MQGCILASSLVVNSIVARLLLGVVMGMDSRQANQYTHLCPFSKVISIHVFISIWYSKIAPIHTCIEFCRFVSFIRVNIENGHPYSSMMRT